MMNYSFFTAERSQNNNNSKSNKSNCNETNEEGKKSTWISDIFQGNSLFFVNLKIGDLTEKEIQIRIIEKSYFRFRHR